MPVYEYILLAPNLILIVDDYVRLFVYVLGISKGLCDVLLLNI